LCLYSDIDIMKLGALVVLGVAAAFAVAHAQTTDTVAYPNFPFCQCIKTPSPYSILPVVRNPSKGTYCFTLNVTKPSPSATGYCATQADVYKIEFNVFKSCDVFGPVVNATLNGKPTKVGPNFDSPAQGPEDARILRLTQLDLGLNSDGAELCLSLGLNNRSRGCATLEDLCVPPTGANRGTCSVALFDSKTNCCPISKPSPPSPPPPPPPPKQPPLAPPPPENIVPFIPCRTCIYLTVQEVTPHLWPFTFSNDICDVLIPEAIELVQTAAQNAGAGLLSNLTTFSCDAAVINICFAFTSPNALQGNVSDILVAIRDLLTPSCPAYLNGYLVKAFVSDYGSDPFGDPVESCLSGIEVKTCSPEKVDFPKCFCDTKALSTRFAALPYLTAAPGRPTNKVNSTLYCFTLAVVNPSPANTYCANTTVLLKAELWGNDAPLQRRKILALAFQEGNSNTLKYISPSWGANGDQTLKVSPLNWTTEEADGAKICLELSNATNLETFCNHGDKTCWINLFSPTKECCPVFAASLLP
ncbi:hypothetical protein VaNZ11_008368, partial [Volvox africanus]